jgi:hypothetical protein
MGLTISDITLREPLCVKPDLGLMEMLGIFQQGQCHLAIVSLDPVSTLNSLRTGIPPSELATPIGLVTMEDVLEKIIQSDIMDETDSTKLDIFPHGGAPTILYHRANQRPKSRSTHKDTVRLANKRKPKERVPSRGSVVTSEYHRQKLHDSEDDGVIPSRHLYYQNDTDFDRQQSSPELVSTLQMGFNNKKTSSRFKAPIPAAKIPSEDSSDATEQDRLMSVV